MSFSTLLAASAHRVQTRLDTALAALDDEPVIHAMRYACQGGKGLRGFFVLESAALHGISADNAVAAAAAIEAMHAYSLVHDDLPCMDNDALRRGLPTVHRKWDEAVAVLAGDALQSLAFELLTDPALGANRLDLIAGMARAAGARGMVLGQALDIAAETATTPLTLAQITRLQSGKTGALFEWSATAGAVLAGADPAPLGRYAAATGLAFQITDDILDVTGDASKTGKRLGKDAEAGKATFVSLLGLEGAKARAAALIDDAKTALAPYGARADTLILAARFVIARES
ncbi:polyprenyl synthetase family protein [Pseudorhodobacter sp.]|uniref:polyprenyl synthetase family protein n=1 Tax=Pseudorhodobacter sp. TaxID=1934400 RepID=UPI002AFF9126|nr:polyprenyl synthetase family protein [Pseudorhodobacter sp.]